MQKGCRDLYKKMPWYIWMPFSQILEMADLLAKFQQKVAPAAYITKIVYSEFFFTLLLKEGTRVGFTMFLYSG